MIVPFLPRRVTISFPKRLTKKLTRYMNMLAKPTTAGEKPRSSAITPKYAGKLSGVSGVTYRVSCEPNVAPAVMMPTVSQLQTGWEGGASI